MKVGPGNDEPVNAADAGPAKADPADAGPAKAGSARSQPGRVAKAAPGKQARPAKHATPAGQAAPVERAEVEPAGTVVPAEVEPAAGVEPVKKPIKAAPAKKAARKAPGKKAAPPAQRRPASAAGGTETVSAPVSGEPVKADEDKAPVMQPPAATPAQAEADAAARTAAKATAAETPTAETPAAETPTPKTPAANATAAETPAVTATAAEMQPEAKPAEQAHPETGAAAHHTTPQSEEMTTRARAHDLAVSTPRTEAWAKIVADPGHAPELLALAATQTIGPRAREWARQTYADYPAATPEAVARLAVAQFTRAGGLSSVFAAVAGSYSPLALLGANAFTYAELVLHIAAAYGLDPADPQRAVDLLVLTGVHAGAEEAEAALATARQPVYEEETRLSNAVSRLGRMVAAQGAAWTVLKGVNRFFPGTTLLMATMTSRNGARTMGAKATRFYSQESHRSGNTV